MTDPRYPAPLGHGTLPRRTRVPDGVGIVGLGAMGGPIARHLAAAGMQTVVTDLDEAAVAAAVAAGATAAASPAALGAASGVVVVVVSTDEQLREVLTGPQGVYTTARPGSVVLLSTSALPETCRELAAEAPSGVDVLDAALTGGVRAAEAGRLTLMVGGDESALEAARPAVAPWTRAVHLLGGVGAGQVGKTVNNLVHWSQISAIAQALELGRRLGGDVPSLRRALQDSPTDSRTLREMELMRFTWFEKDIANARQMARGIDADLSMSETALSFMRTFTPENVRELLS
ncbi:NAD(P)-dependent oxidoreductase [Aeromicrobium wangtongii]|uniref:NAD(P)-dependent oxidoreductase n=1 Tax=Aeromicrobium wangtongii TaxID=2969247 RepID=UPI0020182A7D|nr:NAD(P)-dependent oxidoreductase [Aeromicrobium wangtongii]MCL3817646.1 NAD(P)-dependent oxidoreductase [Aeromicrobium wangtongii]